MKQKLITLLLALGIVSSLYAQEGMVHEKSDSYNNGLTLIVYT